MEEIWNSLKGTHPSEIRARFLCWRRVKVLGLFLVLLLVPITRATISCLGTSKAWKYLWPNPSPIQFIPSILTLDEISR